jgi:hypothetical protein
MLALLQSERDTASSNIPLTFGAIVTELVCHEPRFWSKLRADLNMYFMSVADPVCQESTFWLKAIAP